jgi:hypothetical protein
MVARAKAVLESASPFLSAANLISLVGLIVMGLQSGVIDMTPSENAASQADVAALEQTVTANTSSIAELRRINERQDTSLKAVQNRFGDRLKGIENRLNQIYQVLVQRAEGDDPLLASGFRLEPGG